MFFAPCSSLFRLIIECAGSAPSTLSSPSVSSPSVTSFTHYRRFFEHTFTIMSTPPLLTTVNYSLWEPTMQDFLHSKGYWFWIHATTPTDPKLHTKCLLARDSAVGEIQHHLSPELRGITTTSEEPQAILNAIKLAYGKSSFTTQYNAMQAFLAVKQESSELVPAFISHACEALHFLQSTHPPAAPLASHPASSDPVYLLEDSDCELLISVLLQGTKYSAPCLHSPN
jgi:hypothetical protein